MDESAVYTCPTCGEPITLAVDPTAGDRQEYVEDCPVCCNPNVIRVAFDPDGRASIEAAAE